MCLTSSLSTLAEPVVDLTLIVLDVEFEFLIDTFISVIFADVVRISFPDIVDASFMLVSERVASDIGEMNKIRKIRAFIVNDGL